MNGGKDNAILRLTFDFALNIIKYTELLKQKGKYIVARQLLKALTNILFHLLLLHLF